MNDLENINFFAKKIIFDYQSNNLYSIIDTYLNFLLPAINRNINFFNPNIFDITKKTNIVEKDIYNLCRLLLNNQMSSDEARDEYMEALDSSIPKLVFNKIIDSDVTDDSIDALLEIRPDLEGEPSLSNEEIERLKINMIENLKSLDDNTIDIMDILWSFWLRRAETYTDSVVIHIDDILALKKSGPSSDNSVVSYKKSFRDEVIGNIEILKNTWIIIKEAKYVDVTHKKPAEVTLTGESPLIVIDERYKKKIHGKETITMYAIKPGKMLAEYMHKAGRPLLALSKKALIYNEYSQRDEKRLTRIFSWGWNLNNTTQAYKISKLLELIKKDHNSKRFQRVKEDIETALDVLVNDKVISSYQYSKYPVNLTYKSWLNLTIIVFAPDWLQKYNALKKNSDSLLSASNNIDVDVSEVSYNLGLELKKKRLLLNLSIRDTSKILGISASTLSRIENNGTTTTNKNKETILNWINK